MTNRLAHLVAGNLLFLVFLVSFGGMFVSLPLARALQSGLVHLNMSSVSGVSRDEVLIYPSMLQNALVIYVGPTVPAIAAGHIAISYNDFVTYQANSENVWSNLVAADVTPSAPVVLLNLFTINGPTNPYVVAPASILADPGGKIWAAHIDGSSGSLSRSVPPLLRLNHLRLVPLTTDPDIASSQPQ